MATSTLYELIKTDDEIETAKSPEISLDVEKGMEAGSRAERSTKEIEGEGLNNEIQPNRLMIFRVSGPPTMELPEALMSAVSYENIYAEYNEMKSHEGEIGGDSLVRPLKMDFSLTNSLPYFHPVLRQVSFIVCKPAVIFG